MGKRSRQRQREQQQQQTQSRARHRDGPSEEPARAGAIDAKMLERVRALLAKAESTTFEEEAQALTAKAQELMTKYAIDRAVLAAHAEGVSGDDLVAGVRTRRLSVDDPYASAKYLLLQQIAEANGCRALWQQSAGTATVMGFDTEVDFVELLYTSLLVQATNAMIAAGPQRDASGRSRTRSFRQSFLIAYGGRIGQRLLVAVADTVDEATQTVGPSLLPVLASRRDAVDQAVDQAFPEVRTRRVSVANGAGFRAGIIAADQAELAVTETLGQRTG